MDSADRYRLLSIESDLQDNVDANHIVDHLIEKGVLDPDHDEQIRAERTPRGRTNTLIQILPTTTRDALKHLREALLPHHGFIVTKLDSITVPATQTYTTGAGAGGLRTAAAALNRSADHQLPTVVDNNTTHTYNIRGDDNFVIIGGHSTNINIRR
ncbi:uncharacterized protein [Asterias amurensis]|uniref:uncharacterized protein n=1 Tax=Asterias amurensis TaxID=7602 RepID=UPI003AB28A58